MKHGKKIWWVLSLLVCAVVSNPVLAMAAQESDTGDQLGAGMSLAYCIPFAGMLLCIAICPLVIGDLWDKYKWVAVIFIFDSICCKFWCRTDLERAVRSCFWRLHYIYCVTVWTVLCGGKYLSQRRYGREPEAECPADPDRWFAGQLDRNHRSQYAYDPSVASCQRMEKEKGTDCDFLHFHRFQYWRLSDTGR